MNIDLAVVAEQLNNFKEGVAHVISIFETFPEVIRDFANAFTSSGEVNDFDPEASGAKAGAEK